MADAKLFSFRADPILTANFLAATRQNDRNGSQVLRDFMRTYVEQHQGKQTQPAAHESRPQ